MTGWASRTTICITTMNRAEFFERTLDYYARAGFGGVILVGDGSSGAEAARTRAACERFAGRLRVELIEASDVPQPRLLADMAARVATEFAVYSGDDDFLIPEALDRCESLLDENPDLIAAHGTAVALNSNGARSVPASIDPYRLPSPTHISSIERVEALLSHYAVAIFNLHRREAWRRMWDICADMEDKQIGAEIAACTMSAVLGCTGEIEDLYLVRQIHPQRYKLGDRGRWPWLVSGSFTQSGRLLFERVLSILREDPTNDRESDLQMQLSAALMSYVTPSHSRVGRGTEHDESDISSLWALLYLDSSGAKSFLPVMQSLIGASLAGEGRARMLLSWGNSYVLRDSIGPSLPQLSKRYWIVLLLVDQKLTRQTVEQAEQWKREGVIADFLIAPSHNYSAEAHSYMAKVTPTLRMLDFDVFLSISSMETYERYITDFALPPKCLRLMFWPHPASLFLYPELSAAVQRNDSRQSIDRIIQKLRRKKEPSIWKELLIPHLYTFSVLRCLWIGLTRRTGRSSGQGLPLPPNASDLLSLDVQHDHSQRSDLPSLKKVVTATDEDVSIARTVSRLVRLLPGGRNSWSRFKAAYPELSHSLSKGILTWLRSRSARRQMQLAAIAGSPFFLGLPRIPRSVRALAGISTRPKDWMFVANLDIRELWQAFPFTCDRYIYPMAYVGRWFKYGKFDLVTQIGTDNFDACLFFDQRDADAHKILFNNPNMYAVQLPQRDNAAEHINAVLMPFTLHNESEMAADLYDLYARDLSIVLKESGAREVHLRIHPGRIDPWLSGLADAISDRGVPCQLVAADRPIAEAAARYVGVVGAVSGALRDVVSCPNIFVVGSMALSLRHFSNPKEMIGFPESIGWIEADGSYDPKIFRPVERRESNLPSAAEVIFALQDGKWARVPDRLRPAAQ